MRSKVFFIVLCLIASGLCSCITDGDDNDDREDYALVPGDALPSFSVLMSDGETTIDTRSLSGKVGVIVFFHTDCPDCRKELPVVQRIYDTYKDNPEVLLFCISRSQPASGVSDYWKEHSFTLPYSAQEDVAVFSLFASRVIPRIFITDRQGIIRASHTDDPLATYEELVEEVDGVLNQ